MMNLLGGNMNKSDLIEALSKGENLTITKAEEVVTLFFGEMTNALGIAITATEDLCGNPPTTCQIRRRNRA